MKEKYNKPFIQQYKESKIVSIIFCFLGLFFLSSSIIHISNEKIDQLSLIFLIIGSIILTYSSLLFFLYWKCANYQKKNQSIPKWFRIVSGLMLIFYLSLYQLNEDAKKYRQYLLLKEIRFYLLSWIFLCFLISLLEFQFIQKNNFLWFGISLGIITVILVIDWILAIFIWKYHGTNNKSLKILTIVTLNYRNYRFYQEIIKLNQKTN